ncbi:hypothetical protein QQS45_02570 [Alteriqipengyuania flavescens]|uniref:hypothetical protein n=1 Tax=Alteriqipengyuania flavescens TaxID=3053610 RepID=UPI0025B55782|nr:hypothetical protein [Alteriqipengyuania flavescens]WJY19138.1 hypothetical protein QQW98_02565 [Alteriqipengyuania flavescens]WJY26050.1 hypothetical protein QQS45_02570 [Alteriqipengyuania flavescens]
MLSNSAPGSPRSRRSGGDWHFGDLEMKAGCLIGLALPVCLGLWVWSEDRAMNADNLVAKEAFAELCRTENIFVSGTFADWDRTLEEIREGTFSDSVHLRQWKERSPHETEWPVAENKHVLMSEFVVTFMDSDNEVVLRDFALLQKNALFSISAEGTSKEYCIAQIEPELERLLWS